MIFHTCPASFILYPRFSIIVLNHNQIFISPITESGSAFTHCTFYDEKQIAKYVSSTVPNPLSTPPVPSNSQLSQFSQNSQTQDSILLFQFTSKQNAFEKEIKIPEWRYLDLRRNVCLLLNCDRNPSLLVHCSRDASGNLLSGHFRAEEHISWRTLSRPVQKKTDESLAFI